MLKEDEKLIAYIKKHGQGNWRTLPKNAGESPRPMMDLIHLDHHDTLCNKYG